MALVNDGSNTSNFMGLAPNDYNFTAGKLTDIFCMFNLCMLGASLIRLWALYQAKEATRNKEPIFAVIDPFHLHEDNLKKRICSYEDDCTVASATQCKFTRTSSTCLCAKI
jgi:hypothetical protein